MFSLSYGCFVDFEDSFKVKVLDYNVMNMQIQEKISTENTIAKFIFAHTISNSPKVSNH